MALTFEDAVLCSLGFVDFSNLPASMGLRHTASDDLAAVLDDVDALAAVVEGVTSAAIRSSIISRYASQATGTPDAESDVRRKLFLVFNTNVRDDKPVLEIPSPLPAIEQYGTIAINPAQTAVASVIAALANPLGTGSWLSARGNPLLSINKAYIGTRTRKGQD